MDGKSVSMAKKNYLSWLIKPGQLILCLSYSYLPASRLLSTVWRKGRSRQMFLARPGWRSGTHKSFLPLFRATQLGIVTHSWVTRLLPSTWEDDEFSKHLQLQKKGKGKKKKERGEKKREKIKREKLIKERENIILYGEDNSYIHSANFVLLKDSPLKRWLGASYLVHWSPTAPSSWPFPSHCLKATEKKEEKLHSADTPQNPALCSTISAEDRYPILQTWNQNFWRGGQEDLKRPSKRMYQCCNGLR